MGSGLGDGVFRSALTACLMSLESRQATEPAYGCQGEVLKGAWYSRRHGTSRLLPGAGGLARRVR